MRCILKILKVRYALQCYSWFSRCEYRHLQLTTYILHPIITKLCLSLTGVANYKLQKQISQPFFAAACMRRGVGK